jgi:hypothetical protein
MAVRWEDLLMVGNCRQSWKDFAQHQTYVCPAAAGGFDQKFKQFRAKYFAPFVSKDVRYVSEIEAVVRLDTKTDAEVVWNNTSEPDETLIERAREKLETVGGVRPPCLVYLLNNLRTTELVFDGLGTLSGSRQYFNLTELAPTDAGDLAQKLRSCVWSSLPKYSG